MKAKLEKEGSEFEVKMTAYAGQKIAIGSDFDESTGGLKEGSNVCLISEEKATRLAKREQGSV